MVACIRSSFLFIAGSIVWSDHGLSILLLIDILVVFDFRLLQIKLLGGCGGGSEMETIIIA